MHVKSIDVHFFVLFGYLYTLAQSGSFYFYIM